MKLFIWNKVVLQINCVTADKREELFRKSNRFYRWSNRVDVQYVYRDCLTEYKHYFRFPFCVRSGCEGGCGQPVITRTVDA
jgi:hypothetical protein